MRTLLPPSAPRIKMLVELAQRGTDEQKQQAVSGLLDLARENGRNRVAIAEAGGDAPPSASAAHPPATFSASSLRRDHASHHKDTSPQNFEPRRPSPPVSCSPSIALEPSVYVQPPHSLAPPFPRPHHSAPLGTCRTSHCHAFNPAFPDLSLLCNHPLAHRCHPIGRLPPDVQPSHPAVPSSHVSPTLTCHSLWSHAILLLPAIV